MVNKECYALGAAPNSIRKLFAYGLEQAKKVGAENVFDFSIGNPSIPAPEKVNETIVKLVTETDSVKLHGYSMSGGADEAKKAIAEDLNRRFNCGAGAENLFLTCGAAPGLVAAFKALTVDNSSEIMIIAPYFPEYTVFIERNGAKAVIVPADTEKFQISLDKVEKMITQNTQAVVINSPNNPSGVVYTEETIRALAELLTRKSKEVGHPIYIVSDEPYRELVYGGVTVPFVPNIYPNTLVVYSYSKSLSLPGERVGYVYVPANCDDSADVMFAVAGAARISGHICTPTLFQKTIALCTELRPDLEAYDENRKLLYESLTKMGYECAKPDGAFYMFVKAPNGDAAEFSERAKLEYNLLFVPAGSFGCPTHFRLSYCVSHDMILRALPAFEKLIEGYKK